MRRPWTPSEDAELRQRWPELLLERGYIGARRMLGLLLDRQAQDLTSRLGQLGIPIHVWQVTLGPCCGKVIVTRVLAETRGAAVVAARQQCYARDYPALAELMRFMRGAKGGDWRVT